MSEPFGALTNPRFEATRAHIAAIRAWASPLELATRARIDDALELMIALHIDQADRPGPQPYVEHTAEVAHHVLDWTDPVSPDVVIAACLHDAVEDRARRLAGRADLSGDALRDAALATIRHRFGDRVASLVAAVTNPDLDAIVTARHGPIEGAEREARKNAIYSGHVVGLFENEPEAAAIKLADFGSNAFRLDRIDLSTETGRRRKSKLLRKYEPTMRFLLEHLPALAPGHLLWRHRDRLLARVTAAVQAEFEPATSTIPPESPKPESPNPNRRSGPGP